MKKDLLSPAMCLKITSSQTLGARGERLVADSTVDKLPEVIHKLH